MNPQKGKRGLSAKWKDALIGWILGALFFLAVLFVWTMVNNEKHSQLRQLITKEGSNLSHLEISRT